VTQDGPGQFGERLQRHRMAVGLSQEELAERAGLSQRGISDLERGKRRTPHPATVRRLAEALGLTEADRTGLLGAARTPSGTPATDAVRAEGDVRDNLPLQLTSFIGRVQETADIRRELAKTRLLTLAGPGGVGKTRLALHVAEQELENYEHGVWFVELAPLQEATLVPQLVANIFNVHENPQEPLIAALTRRLQPLDLLLILDNCEHVVAGCVDLVHRLLRACRHIVVLTTSREVLGLAGESVWRVPPLRVPEPRAAPAPERVAESEAEALFVERARAVQPSFAITTRNATALVEVCRRLEGIPLAIELAASRVNVLSLEQIAGRVATHFRFLSSKDPTAASRQQTLEKTFQWSYDLLTSVERHLLDRLSVFAGGWSLEAMEAVAGRDTMDCDKLLDLLERLIDRSLIQTVPDAICAARYRMLETIRQFARERLEATGEAHRVLWRHAHYYLEVAERGAQQFRGANQVRIAAFLELEHDNLRAALRWYIARGEVELGLRLGGALARFWLIRGHNREGRDWLEQLLELPVADTGSVPHLQVRAEALSGVGFLALRQSDFGVARDLFEESLTIRREVGDLPGVARCLSDLGVLADEQGDFVQAISLHEQSQTIRSQLDDRLAVGTSLNNLGIAIGHRSAVRAINGQGSETEHQQDYARARRLVEDALAIRREFDDLNRIADSLLHLGYLADLQSDYSTARRAFEEALVIARDLGSTGSITQALQGFSVLAAVQGQAERALLLDGAAARLRDLLGTPLPFAAQLLSRHRLLRVRDMIGDVSADAARERGGRLTLDQAVACALEQARSSSAAPLDERVCRDIPGK
jgi:predicted ATPase/DNA-binding XRE family transcriptional regulator